jgi:hypothetical protein
MQLSTGLANVVHNLQMSPLHGEVAGNVDCKHFVSLDTNV